MAGPPEAHPGLCATYGQARLCERAGAILLPNISEDADLSLHCPQRDEVGGRPWASRRKQYAPLPANDQEPTLPRYSPSGIFRELRLRGHQRDHHHRPKHHLDSYLFRATAPKLLSLFNAYIYAWVGSANIPDMLAEQWKIAVGDTSHSADASFHAWKPSTSDPVTWMWPPSH